MVNPFLSFAGGFAKKLNDVNDENRQKQARIEERAAENFQKALEMYRANKSESDRMARQAQEYARQLGGDAAAVEAGKFMVSNGFSIEQLELGKQYADSVRKKLSEGVTPKPPVPGTGQGGNPPAPEAPAAAGAGGAPVPGIPQPGQQMQPQMPQGNAAQQQADRTPMSGAVNPTQTMQMPQNAAAPNLQPQNLGPQDRTAANLLLGQRTPQQQQQGINQRIGAEYNMTPDEIQRVQQGQFEKPRLEMDPSIPAGEIDPGALVQRKALVQWITQNPDDIKDGMQDQALAAANAGQPITPFLRTREEKIKEAQDMERFKNDLRPDPQPRGATLMDMYNEIRKSNPNLDPKLLSEADKVVVDRVRNLTPAERMMETAVPAPGQSKEAAPAAAAPKDGTVVQPRTPPPTAGKKSDAAPEKGKSRLPESELAKIRQITSDPEKQKKIEDIYLDSTLSDEEKISEIEKVL